MIKASLKLMQLLKIPFVFLFFAVSCQSPEPRYPIQYKSGKEMDVSVQINKTNKAAQEKIIQDYISKHPDNKFVSSKYGFWLAVDEEKPNNLLAVKGDLVTFEYEILDFENRVLYDKKSLGVQTYLVDKQPLIKVLQLAVKMIKEGEKATLLAPSFFAFRTDGGKFKKIGLYQPIIINIHLITIKKNEKNEIN